MGSNQTVPTAKYWKVSAWEAGLGTDVAVILHEVRNGSYLFGTFDVYNWQEVHNYSMGCSAGGWEWPGQVDDISKSEINATKSFRDAPFVNPTSGIQWCNVDIPGAGSNYAFLDGHVEYVTEPDLLYNYLSCVYRSDQSYGFYPRYDN